LGEQQRSELAVKGSMNERKQGAHAAKSSPNPCPRHYRPMLDMPRNPLMEWTYGTEASTPHESIPTIDGYDRTHKGR